MHHGVVRCSAQQFDGFKLFFRNFRQLYQPALEQVAAHLRLHAAFTPLAADALSNKPRVHKLLHPIKPLRIKNLRKQVYSRRFSSVCIGKSKKTIRLINLYGICFTAFNAFK